MNNIPNNPYGQVIMHHYEYNISKYQLHQMVKVPKTWVKPSWPQTCTPTMREAQLLYWVFFFSDLHHSKSIQHQEEQHNQIIV
jgi:hypothetical protein